MFHKVIYSKDNVSSKGPYVLAECSTELDFFDFEDENWENGNVNLLKFKVEDKIVPDYLFNDLNLRLISNKFKEILENNSNVTNLVFLPVEVYQSNDFKHSFWLVIFKKLFEVIDENRSLFSAGELISPMFLEELVSESVFNYVGGMNDWFIDNNLRQKLKTENLTGVDFRLLKGQ